jgi:PAS domain S-box-containing protein
MQFERTPLVDSLQGLGCTALNEGRAECVNQRWLDYTGLTAEQAAGLGWVEAIHPHDREGLIEYWRSCVVSGTPGDTEARIRRYDGAYRWFLFRANPVRDAAGAITAWYLLLTDIEDRKKAEEALRSNERDLNLIINTIPTSIHVLRTDGTVLYVNQVVLDYTGLTLEDVQKQDYRDRVFHPDDVKRVGEERGEALTQAVPFENEQRVLRKDGRYRWFLMRFSPLLDAQGEIDRWYVASFDIEDRKRAEAQLEQAYLRLAEAQRLSKTGSFISDVLVDDHQWSEEAFRIFEFDPTTKITVRMVRDRVHPEDLPAFDSVIAQGMTGAEVDFYYRILTPRGAVKHVRGMARIVEQIAGRPLFIGAVQDVTESRSAEEALNRARSELAQVSRVTTLNTLTASIAHEVNQPLSGIITNASTCQWMLNGKSPDVEGARETVRRILRDGNRAAHVISRLRVLFSRKEFTLEPLDLNEATREVIALSLSDLQANRVMLRTELADDLPSATGDRVQLQQVILNLLRNASDAMVGIDDRPRELLIKTTPEGGDAVRLSVVDVGVGFRSEVADKLFEAFFTTKNDGMGIGLSVSRSIIEAHHGRLWATANDGPGSTFSFSIPCSPTSTRVAHDVRYAG